MDLKTREGRRQQGELIKAAATAAGLTLKELATRLGVSHALIYQYVSGANLAQPDKLQEIAELTGMPVAYFFGESTRTGESTGPGDYTRESPVAAIPSDRTAGARAASAEPSSSSLSGTAEAPPAPPIDAARLQQNLRQLDVLAQAQETAGRDLPGLLRTLEQMLGLARLAGDRRREADLLYRIGNARTDSGDIKGAADSLEECLALYRDAGLQERALMAVQSLARCRSLTGQSAEAEALFREVAASSHRDLAWRGLVGLGQIMEQRDRYEEALAEYERAGEIIDASSGGELAAHVRPLADLFIRMNLGNVYMAEGDFESAAPLWRESMEKAEELSQPDQFLEALLSDAVCQLHLGRPGLAHDASRRLIRLCRLLGDRERLAIARSSLAETLATAGLAEAGKEEAREAAKLAAETASVRGVSFANLALARNLLVADQADSASFYLEPEIQSESRKVQAAALLLRSELHRRQNNPDGAAEDARAALMAVRDPGARHLQKASLAALAAAAARQGSSDVLQEAITGATALDRLTPGLPDTGWQLAAAQGHAARLRGDTDAALGHFQRAIRLIQELRADFAAHGVLETCLDDAEKLQVYRDALTAADAAGDTAARDVILAESDWPPLIEESGGIRGA